MCSSLQISYSGKISRTGRQRGPMVKTPGFESEIPGSIPALTTSSICNTANPSFNSSTMLVNSQLVSLPPVGILNKFMLDLRYLFLYLQYSQLTQQCQIHWQLNKVIVIGRRDGVVNVPS